MLKVAFRCHISRSAPGEAAKHNSSEVRELAAIWSMLRRTGISQIRRESQRGGRSADLPPSSTKITFFSLSLSLFPLFRSVACPGSYSASSRSVGVFQQEQLIPLMQRD